MSEPVDDPGREPTPEEIMDALARRLAATPVHDVLMQTMATFADMAAIRLGLGPGGAEDGDLPQAHMAIEALRALVDVADGEIGAAAARPFREPLAALQMAYARAVEAEARASQAEQQGEGGSGLWTPPGSTGGPGPGGGRLWTPGSDT